MEKSAVRIDRRWIGASQSVWNPTVSLFVVAAGGFAAGTAGLIAGVLPTAFVVPWNAICLYLSFTVMHDATHGTAHRSKKVGLALGRICGLALLAPLPIFWGVHHEHHGHTNDPARDPDLFVAMGPAWFRPFSLALAIPGYRWHFYRRRMWRNREAFREALACDLSLLALLLWAFVAGPADVVLTAWIGPLLLAAMWLAFAFDYLPHYPHGAQARYYDTRVYPGRWANRLLLGQNYHLIHHLWTTIPWYHYQQVFQEIEPQLRERGCAIGWNSEALVPEGVEPSPA